MKSMIDCVIHQAFKKIDIGAWIGGECARKVEVVVGVSEPLERGKKNAVFGEGLCPFDDLSEEHAVGGDGKVMSVLFDGGDGEDDGRVWREVAEGGPREIGEVHGVWVPGWKLGAAGSI